MHRLRLVSLFPALALLAACQDSATDPSASSSSPSTTAALPAAEGFPVRGELRQGWVRGEDGKPMQVTYEVQEGMAVWNGDILLGRAEAVARTREELVREEGGARRGVVITTSGSRWPGGVVPYVIDPSLPSQSRVTDAIAHIESQTGDLDFVPRTTQTDYLRIVPSTGCSSFVGRQGGMQDVFLASTCTTGNTIHELLHAVGMYHEHTRCDRDTYVTINWANIQSGASFNFDAQCTNATDYGAYAEGSIMHYGPYAFSANGQATITSKRGLASQMGQRNGMGTTDIQTVNWMYPLFLASISGKQYVAKHESAQYTANVTGGIAPLTYEWRTRQSGPSTSGSWSGWYSTGSSNVTYASINSCGLNTNYLEVRVTDATGDQTTGSYTIYITNPC